MRQLTLLLLAGMIAATPAVAQNAAAPNEIDDPQAEMVTNDTGAATTDPIAPDPALTTPATPPTVEAPGVSDATVTPETGENRGGFPWGLLGLLGLAGLIGRSRS